MAKKRSKTEAVEKNLTEKDRAYTAVELVTKACKVCEIMENTEKHSSTFTTADWTFKTQKIPLIDGASLSPEIEIVISNKEATENDRQGSSTTNGSMMFTTEVRDAN